MMWNWWEDVQRQGPLKSLNFLTQVPPLTFDPMKSFDLVTRNVMANLYEGLLLPELQTLEPQPGIAISWEVLDNGRTYVFQLRPNTRFSDGEPILSKDIIFSFNRISQSQELGMTVTQLQARTILIQLEQPIHNFLRLLTTPPFSVVSQRSVEKNDFQRESLISSGPFRLKSNSLGSHPSLVILEKNPYYWDAESVKLEGAVYIPIMDPDERLRVFRTRYSPSGERIYYFLNHGPVLRYKELQHDPELQPMSVLATILLTPNGSKWPLNDVRVRKALSLAIDRQKLVDNLLPYLNVADGLIPRGIGKYPEFRHLVYEDLEQAKSLLKEAGFPAGDGFPDITLTILDQDYMELLAQHLIQDWRRILGINVRSLRLSWGDYLKHVENDNYYLLYETWHTDIGDPCSFFVPLSTGHPSNRACYSSVQFDEIIERSLDELDDTKRMLAYLEAEKNLIDNMAIIPLMFESHFCMVDSGVTNARLNKSAILPLKYIELV